MKRRFVLAALLVALIAPACSPAWAQTGAAGADSDQSVTLAEVALPIVVDGHLVNYVFVTAKVLLTPHADVYVLRDKEPYFRDALVRAAHRTPFVLRNDYNHVDTARLTAALVRDARTIVGAQNVAGAQVISQTAQHRLPAPH